VDWVKLATRYYLDPAVASLPDADTELLFVRGLAYAGAEETGGFIPEVIVPSLIRRRRYGAAVEALVARSLWVISTGDGGQPGYRIRRWEDWQEELDALARRRASDRERKRKQRHAERESAQVEGVSRDMSAEMSRDRPHPKEVEGDIDKPKKTTSSSGARKRATRIPDDFTVTPDMADWARQHVPHLIGAGLGSRETDKFRNYWQAKSGRDATKHDWVATWRNWLLKADDDLGRNGGRVTAMAAHRPQSGRQNPDDEYAAALARIQARKENGNDTGGNGHNRAPSQISLPAAAD
jgi:hypothetical protein